MDIIEDYKQTLGLSYLDIAIPKTKPVKEKLSKIRPTLSVRDSILKYLNRPAI